MDFKDYYQILGVTKDATQDQIKKAYRALAREHHPDVNTSEAGEDRFKEIGEAYGVLRDKEKRSKYDQYGAAWKAAEQGSGNGYGGHGFDFADVDSAFGSGEFGSFYDILEHVFGGRGSRAGSGFDPRSGAANPYGGFRVNVGGDFGSRFSASGATSARGSDREVTVRLTMEEAGRGGRRSIRLVDPSSGKKKTYNVNLPKGALPGQRIRLAGQGHTGSGVGPAGDLYLVVEILPHSAFRLAGKDLHTSVDVAAWEAALGATVALETLDGAVRVKVPAGVRPGQEIRLRGKGYPAPDGAGDLLVTLRICVPEELTAESRELYEKLAELGGGPASDRNQSTG